LPYLVEETRASGKNSKEDGQAAEQRSGRQRFWTLMAGSFESGSVRAESWYLKRLMEMQIVVCVWYVDVELRTRRTDRRGLVWSRHLLAMWSLMPLSSTSLEVDGIVSVKLLSTPMDGSLSPNRLGRNPSATTCT